MKSPKNATLQSVKHLREPEISNTSVFALSICPFPFGVKLTTRSRFRSRHLFPERLQLSGAATRRACGHYMQHTYLTCRKSGSAARMMVIIGYKNSMVGVWFARLLGYLSTHSKYVAVYYFNTHMSYEFS